MTEARPQLAEIIAAVQRAGDRQRGIVLGESITATLGEAGERRQGFCLAQAVTVLETVERHSAAIRALLRLPPRLYAAVADGPQGLAELYGGDPPGPAADPSQTVTGGEA